MDIRQWVNIWQGAGAELKLIRARELRSIDTTAAVLSLSKAYQWAAKRPPRPSSGLVEQQAIFLRLRDR